MKWTSDLDNKLKELYASGMSRQDIAKEFNTNTNSVIHRIDKLKLKRKNTNYIEFTDKQILEILDRYKTESLRKIASDFGVSAKTIQRVLEQHNIQIQSYRWTDNEEQKLIELSTDHTLDEIAYELNRTKQAVYTKAKLLGIGLLEHRRLWSKNDDKFIRENWGIRTLAYISSKLHRSKEACILRAKHLGLGGAISNSEYVLLVDFCKAVGTSKETVLKNWVPLGFKLKYLKITKTRQFKAVDLKESLAWMEIHQDLFDGSRVEELFFLPEPDWLKQKRENDYKDKSKLKSGKPKQYWSDFDIQRLKSKLNLGLTHQEIANSLGRSIESVNYKVSQLNLGYTAKKFWTGQEFKFIRDNWETMTDIEMAKHLNRPVRSVQYHRQQMGYKRR